MRPAGGLWWIGWNSTCGAGTTAPCISKFMSPQSERWRFAVSATLQTCGADLINQAVSERTWPFRRRDASVPLLDQCLPSAPATNFSFIKYKLYVFKQLNTKRRRGNAEQKDVRGPDFDTG